MRSSVDQIGVAASTVCALHCVSCALIPVVISAWGLGALLSHELEWLFTSFAALLACWAAWGAWRQGRSWVVLTLFSLGVTALLASRIIEVSSAHEGHHEGHHVETSVSHEPHGARTHQVVETEEGSMPEHHGEGMSHLAGAAVAGVAGLLLVLGHLMNIREIRRDQEECCV